MPTAGWWEALWPDPAGVLTEMSCLAGPRVDFCKRSSNVLGFVIQPCYEIGALLFLIFGRSLHFPASSRRKISRWQPMGRRRAASLAGTRPDDIPFPRANDCQDPNRALDGE